ncbi:hypothetical protein LTS18_005307, partial [Coniosporium uncinatum]
INSRGESIHSRGDSPELLRVPPPTRLHESSSSRPQSPHPDLSDEREDSSEEDDPGPAWREIHEDTSTPSETELREMEAMGQQTSALDHDHWEKETFSKLEDPEYVAGPSGRLHWTIDNYNGTKDKPNRELVMKSNIANIGGYNWQIKFYPRGNDSDYLSIYVECVDMVEEKAKELAQDSDDIKTNGEVKQSNGIQNAATKANTFQPPIKPLSDRPIRVRPGVAAQVSVVLYNPAEPRVRYYHKCEHRFCPGSPDWGWTRFHGPYYEIQHRHRNQYAALLHNDTLAFTCYVRIVEDETGCLYEHSGKDNAWDSFAITGLQAMTISDGTRGSPVGNRISAVASWMLLRPFREFLYDIQAPDPYKEPRNRPMLLIAALQKILYGLRAQIKPGAGPVSLEDLIDALEWYGISTRLEKLDVVQIWEIFRCKIEEEVRGTPFAKRLTKIFGAAWKPSYRLPVKGLSTPTMQSAVEAASLQLPSGKLDR